MIQGFSNAAPLHDAHTHLEFDAAMPMPFKIPAVLTLLLAEETDLDFTNKQKDLIEALRFSLKAKNSLFEKMQHEESALLEKMQHEGEDTHLLKIEYQEIQTHKMEASEIFFDLINTMADELDAQQYKKLLALAGISL